MAQIAESVFEMAIAPETWEFGRHKLYDLLGEYKRVCKQLGKPFSESAAKLKSPIPRSYVVRAGSCARKGGKDEQVGEKGKNSEKTKAYPKQDDEVEAKEAKEKMWEEEDDKVPALMAKVRNSKNMKGAASTAAWGPQNKKAKCEDTPAHGRASVPQDSNCSVEAAQQSKTSKLNKAARLKLCTSPAVHQSATSKKDQVVADVRGKVCAYPEVTIFVFPCGETRAPALCCTREDTFRLFACWRVSESEAVSSASLRRGVADANEL